MAEALRAEYKLCEIPPVMGMAKSSCEYAGNARAKGETEERAAARKAVVEAFGASGGTCGHRRITAAAGAGEWTVRGIMGDEGPVARAARKKRRYGSAARARARSSRRPEPAARRGGHAPFRGRQAQRAVGHRRGRVPHPRRQGVPPTRRGLLRRHAVELVDIDLARCRDSELVPDRRARAARRRGAVPRRTWIEVAITAGRAG